MDNGWAEVNSNLDKLAKRVRHNAQVLLAVAGTQTSNQAKSVAPWTDRTGNARRSITNVDTSDDDIIRQTVGMGSPSVPYTVYLETSNGGKYRVIDPVVFGFGKQAMQDAIKDLINVG